MRKFLLFMFVMILIVGLVGCKKDTSTFDIYGTVVEEGTSIPLVNAEITIGSTTVTTDLEGKFKYEDLLKDSYQMAASLEGYDPYSSTINLNADLNLKVELATEAPMVDADYLILNGEGLGDEPLTITDTIVNFSGNLNDLLSDRTGISALSTSIGIDQLLLIVNGEIYQVYVEPSGSFNQDIPVDPGSNVIQLRVIDDNGYAGTSNVVRVTVNLPRLDIRGILKWDTDETDVDLHMFKRQSSEQNPVADDENWWGEDRHVCYFNPAPSDFGTTSEQNPFLDIDDTDGYGPETIVLQEATPGNYHVWVHYYSAYSSEYVGDTPTNANVRLVINGGTEQAQVITLEKKLTVDWEFWYLGYVSWPSGTFVPAADTSNSNGIIAPLGKGTAPEKKAK